MGLPLQTIFGWIVAYRYAILLPIAIVEGPIVSVIAGFLISIGQMDFWIAFGLLSLGDVLGDVGLYSIGRWGGLALISKHGARFGVTPERIKKLETFFEHHAKKTLLFGKWGHVLGFPILVTAGVAREPLGEFIAVSIIGTLPKTLALVFLGIYFGASYGLVNHYLDIFVVVTLVVLAIVGGGYWFFKKSVKTYFGDF